MSINFDNTEIAFKHLDDRGLQRAYLLFLSFNKLALHVGSSLVDLAIKCGLPIYPLIRHTVFKQFCGGETLDQAEAFARGLAKHNVGAVLDYAVEAKACESEFNKTFAEITRIIPMAPRLRFPIVVFKMSGITSFSLLEKYGVDPRSLNAKESEAFQLLKKRCEILCQKSVEANVSIMIDAEETWIQEAIDVMVEELMQTFNRKRVVVYQTIQMYRTDRLAYLEDLITKAHKATFHVGIKLVRGAYLEKERLRAKKNGYPSPLYETKDQTDHAFNEALRLCMKNNVWLFAGTHNEASTQRVIELMQEDNLKVNDPRVIFSQLLGMSDNLTFNLAAQGYNVAKYVPYGPVAEALPYLIRRAQENQSVLGQASRQLKLVAQEMKRRRQSPKL